MNHTRELTGLDGLQCFLNHAGWHKKFDRAWKLVKMFLKCLSPDEHGTQQHCLCLFDGSGQDYGFYLLYQLSRWFSEGSFRPFFSRPLQLCKRNFSVTDGQTRACVVTPSSLHQSASQVTTTSQSSRVESGCVLLPLTVALGSMSHLRLKTHCLCSPLCSSLFVFSLCISLSVPHTHTHIHHHHHHSFVLECARLCRSSSSASVLLHLIFPLNRGGNSSRPSSVPQN